MKISIIIVHYKVKEKLFECLKSIYASKPKTPFEIIVVDNDEVKTIGKDLKKQFPKLSYIKSTKNLGYGGGNNLGAKNAKGEILFFLNPDTQVTNGAIDELYDFLKQHKEAGIVSPLIVGSDNKPLDRQGYKELNFINAFFTFSFLRKSFRKFSVAEYYSLDDWKKQPVKEVETVYGAALMIPSGIFHEVGRFDEEFFLYFEENDLSKRVRKIGYKLYIDSASKIIHRVAQSTNQLKERDKYFEKSRYLYFKKYFGILQALSLELILKINKTSLFILALLVSALALRLYNLSNGMIFIGDQGWFYLSARDLLIKGIIPLVGITSSHTWLHQGPLWTYMLALGFLIFKFNPLSGAYITIFTGLLSILAIYLVGANIFSKKVGLISAFLYAFSPLIVFYDRMPFDPTPIPLFTILYILAIYKWIKGNIKYFPLILFLIAVLYNLELSTFILFFPFLLIFLYGLIKKKQWLTGLKNSRILIYSALAVIVPMFPIIVYDSTHGFTQTIIFLGWTVYKPFSFLIKHSSGSFTGNLYRVLVFLGQNIQKLVLQSNFLISLLLFILSSAYLIYLNAKNNFKIEEAKFVLFILLLFSFAGILANQTPSDAYLFILFPLIIYSVSLLFEFILKFNNLKYPVLAALIIIAILNIYSSYNNDKVPDLEKRQQAVNKIISLAGNKEYNLIGRGEGSQFVSFTMNYEYLLWYGGHPPSRKDANTKIVVWETKNGIRVYKP